MTDKIKTIEARFDSKCETCDEKITRGETIAYATDNRKGHHVACVEALQALRVEAAEALSGMGSEVAGVMVMVQRFGEEKGRRLTVRLDEEGMPTKEDLEEWGHSASAIQDRIFRVMDLAVTPGTPLMLRGQQTWWDTAIALRTE